MGKYKPYFLVQRCHKSDFVINYFNGKYLCAMNEPMISALLEANERTGERFNCVVSVALDSKQTEELQLAVFKEIANNIHNGNQLMALALIQLIGDKSDNVNVLQMNPQMAAMFAKFGKKQGLTYRFEMNWKGAEILADVCKSDALREFREQLEDLMEDLTERRESWEEVK